MTLPDLTQLTLLAVESARTGDAATLRRALDAGVDVAALTACGDSLLTLACAHGHVEVVGLLLQCGGTPDVRGAQGQTPLEIAVRAGRLDLASLLLSAGATVDARGASGRTALMVAAAAGRAEAVRWLLARGADPSLRDARGARAVDLALGHGAVVSLLSA